MAEAPVFAVVGRVNKGKSSIIATLAEDDSVRIGPDPGTTTAVRRFPVSVDDRPLFTLVDTPGFQEAGRALHWMRARAQTAADRPRLVAELVRQFKGTGELVDECRLLEPILEGASILYVVDGTRPYRPDYEDEMEILRWTGRPGMALVNRIHGDDHAEEWRRALDQYFKIVRDFDAHAVSFEERLRLLETFRELRPEWRGAIDEAVTALRSQRRRRRHEAAGLYTGLLVDALTLTLETAVRDEAELEAERDRLERAFHDRLRRREAEAWRSVERLYAHTRPVVERADLDRAELGRDLFAEETWRMLGLTPGQLVATGAATGAVAGGGLDALVGGASFFTGTVLGAAVGAGTALYEVGRRFARVRVVDGGLASSARRVWSGGPRFRIGPHQGRNFPWVLLDRALLHFEAVATRAHARRDAARLTMDRVGPTSRLDREARAELEATFRRLRKEHDDPGRRTRDALYHRVRELLAGIDPAGE